MTPRPSRRLVTIVAVSTCVALLGAYLLAAGARPPGESYQPDSASRADLEHVAELRVFFAHQSVGRNILAGIDDVYEAHSTPAPHFVDVADASPTDPLIDVRIGRNGDPLGKITEFDELVRGGLGDHRDVALLKLCYSDVRAETDVELVFETYRDTLAELQEDFPGIAFVAATVPLTIRRSVAGTVKEWVGRGDRYGPEHNLAREQFNSLLRAEYADPGQLFDIAAIESTAADGRRETGEYGGHLHYALDRSYALDPGHLNEAGSMAAADGLLSLLAMVGRE